MNERKGTAFMSVWHGVEVRRAAGVVLTAAVLTFSLTACGGDGEGEKGGDAKSASASSAAPSKTVAEPSGDSNTVPNTENTLATINGNNGIQLVVHTAVRDEAGFITVTGVIKNNGGKMQMAPLEWNGQEPQIQRTGRSLGGITLVDKAEKKRYYVLRDTDGFPLTTTGIDMVKGGESKTFFAQFPAPPASTTKVEIQVPTMPPATIEIS